jgi:hypothetical protein
MEPRQHLLQKFCVLKVPQPANRVLLVKRWRLVASQRNHGCWHKGTAGRGDKEREKTHEDRVLLDPRSSVHTGMFTISPGDETALEEHDAGETAKSVGDG